MDCVFLHTSRLLIFWDLYDDHDSWRFAMSSFALSSTQRLDKRWQLSDRHAKSVRRSKKIEGNRGDPLLLAAKHSMTRLSAKRRIAFASIFMDSSLEVTSYGLYATEKIQRAGAARRIHSGGPGYSVLRCQTSMQRYSVRRKGCCIARDQIWQHQSRLTAFNG